MKNTCLLALLFAILLGNSTFSQTKKWTLEECVNYALKNNISIKQSELDIQVAAVAKKDALASFLPNVNASTTHSWNIGLNQNITTGLLENQTTQFTQVGLNSGVAIYNGLQNQNRFRRANLSKVASEFQLSKMKDDVSLNVANAFLQILFNKENLKVQKEQLSNDEIQQKRSEELVAAGVIPRGDLLDMKATVANDQQNVINAENNLFLSKLSLAQLLQLDDIQNFDIADNDYEVKASATMLEKPQVIVDKAKQERIELKIAKSNLDIAESDLKIAKGAYQPSLNGFYSFSTRASNSDRIIRDEAGNLLVQSALPIFDQFSEFKGHNFGFNLQIPIFNGFTVKNNVERSRIALERNKTILKQTEQDLERNVYTAITNAKGAINSYEAAAASLEARKEAFNYAKERFAVGMMNSFDFNQSQTLYANAQSEVLRTKYDSIFKVKIVEFYFGIPITNRN
jgi:outer membrane protein